VTDEIEDLARTDVSCGRLMTVPGIGPIIASAMVAAIGDGASFARGRDFAAWFRGAVSAFPPLFSLARIEQ
jgi:transposase